MGNVRYCLGWEMLGIVCDGKRGLLGGIRSIPTQMCHFHQQQIIQRYLTKNPKLEAGKELKEVSSWIGKGKYKVMKELLEDWYRRYQVFLNEKNEEGGFKHKRVRQAYRSLKNNLKYLYTYEFLKEKIQLPTTTNSLEAVFGHLKQKIGIHRGLKKTEKIKIDRGFSFKIATQNFNYTGKYYSSLTCNLSLETNKMVLQLKMQDIHFHVIENHLHRWG